MSGRIQSKHESRIAFDAQGRKIAAGFARLRGADGEKELALWCEGNDGAVMWAMEREELPEISVFTMNPARTELLVGSDKRQSRIALQTGKVVQSDLQVQVHEPWWGEDQWVFGTWNGKCVRCAFDGTIGSPWPVGAGLVGRILEALESWLVTSSSTLVHVMDASVSDWISVQPRPISVPDVRFIGAHATAVGRRIHVIASLARLDGKSGGHNCAWVAFDSSGAIVHRMGVRFAYATTDAAVDSEGRLFVRGRIADDRWAIVGVDSRTCEAVTIAESKNSDVLERFAIGPAGEVVFRNGKVPKRGGGAPVEVVPWSHAEARWRRWALPGVGLAALASAPFALLRRETLLGYAARGESFQTYGETGVIRWTPSELEALAPGIAIQAAMAVFMALGFIPLARMARITPSRAAMAGVAWIVAVGLLTTLLVTFATMLPMGMVAVTTVSLVPFLVSLVAFVFLAAAASNRRR